MAAPVADDNDDVDAYVQEVVARAPPLTSKQRDTLRRLLSNSHRT